jgi:hypothetical protein
VLLGGRIKSDPRASPNAERTSIAVVRKLATILHRMWADGTQFAWGKDDAAVDA